MQYLRKIWVRIIISLLGGCMMMELLHITAGDPNRPMRANFSLLFAIIIFAILSLYIRVVDWRRSKNLN